MRMTDNIDSLLRDLKSHLRLLDNDFDNQLAMYIRSAITAAENSTGIFIMKEDLSLSYPFSHKIDIREYPLAISIVNVDGVPLQPEQYRYDGMYLFIDAGVSGKEVTVQATVGYDSIPEDIRMAVLLIAAKFFQSPVDSVENLPKASENLLRPYRRYNV